MKSEINIKVIISTSFLAELHTVHLIFTAEDSTVSISCVCVLLLIRLTYNSGCL